jgi:hypothetical protein
VGVAQKTQIASLVLSVKTVFVQTSKRLEKKPTKKRLPAKKASLTLVLRTQASLTMTMALRTMASSVLAPANRIVIAPIAPMVELSVALSFPELPSSAPPPNKAAARALAIANRAKPVTTANVNQLKPVVVPIRTANPASVVTTAIASLHKLAAVPIRTANPASVATMASVNPLKPVVSMIAIASRVKSATMANVKHRALANAVPPVIALRANSVFRAPVSLVAALPAIANKESVVLPDTVSLPAKLTAIVPAVRPVFRVPVSPVTAPVVASPAPNVLAVQAKKPVLAANALLAPVLVAAPMPTVPAVKPVSMVSVKVAAVVVVIVTVPTARPVLTASVKPARVAKPTAIANAAKSAPMANASLPA